MSIYTELESYESEFNLYEKELRSLLEANPNSKLTPAEKDSLSLSKYRENIDRII